MPSLCTICSQPEREQIDAPLVAGESSFCALAPLIRFPKRSRSCHIPMTWPEQVGSDTGGRGVVSPPTTLQPCNPHWRT